MARGGAIGSLFVSLGLDSAQFGKGLKGARTGLQKFGSAVKTGMKAVGVAVAGAATAMGLAVKGTIDAADKMSKAAQKFGVPIEELSRLKHAADLSGVSFEGMGTGLRRLSQNMNDAANGVGEGLEAFEQLGIKVTDADGKLRSTTDVMAEMADRFNAMPDGAEKTALAMDLMGRSGTDMIPLLNGGSEALRGMLAEADQFGQVFTQEMGSSAEAFNDNITRLKGTFASLTAAIAADLLPHLERFSQWAVDNSPQIREFASIAIEMFVDLARAVGAVGGAIGKAVAFFQNLDDGLRQFGETVRGGTKQLAADVVAAFRALPGQMLQIGKQIITGLWDGLKSQFAAVKDGVANFASGLVGSVKDTLGIQSPSTVMREIGVNIMQGLADGMTSMQDGLGSIMESIGQTVSSAFEGVIDGSKSVRDAIADVLKSLAQLAVNSAFRSLFGGGVGGGGGLFGDLLGFAHGGSFTVGGSGGIDSQLVAFRATPDETVEIRKPGQDRGGDGLTVAPVYNIDARGSDHGVDLKIRAALAENNRQLPGLIQNARSRGRID